MYAVIRRHIRASNESYVFTMKTRSKGVKPQLSSLAYCRL